MIENIDGYSMDLEKMNKEKLKTVFPECFLEDKLVINKLLALCGKYTIEDFEKYRFDWKGKSECLQLAQKRSSGTLRPCPEESVNFDNTKNIYIEGDNLEVLKLLQTSYFRKVKMIYIDPPYNTGNDFIYKDDYTEPMERYKEVTSQATKSNPETMGRFHTNWLNMMYPRLRLAANLLKDDGVIFISIDDNELDNLKKLCNETFGEENFLGMITWIKKTKPINSGAAKYQLQSKVEYILVYCKSKNFNETYKFKLKTVGERKYTYKTEKGYCRLKDIEDSDYGMKKRDTMKFPILGVTPQEGKRWKLGENEVKNLIEKDRIKIIDNKVKVLVYPEDEESDILKPFWSFLETTVGTAEIGKQELNKLFEENIGFDTVKPINLIKELLEHVENENDIVLDFFSGSGTTAHAVMQLNAEDGGNRQFIMVQLPEVCDEKTEAYKAGYKNICEIGKERIRRAGKKILEENSQLTLEEKETPLDVGFKVLKLDTSNLYQWDTTPIGEEEVSLFIQRICDTNDGIKPDRTDLEVIYELMLKMGIPLHIPVFPIEVNNKQAYSIGEDCLVLVCFADGIVPEDIEEMREYAPACLIMADKSFADDSVLANAKYILKDTGIELKLV